MTVGPLVTIGIPTYRRPEYLRASLACALAQSYANVEILVFDNAGCEHSRAIVDEAGGRARYHRNEINLGALGNFAALMHAARGEYFVLLQDDDAIFGDFCQRAVAALQQSDEIAAYLAYAAYTDCPDALSGALIMGPPLAANWREATARVVSGAIVAPISLFVSVAIPPTIMFRTALLRETIDGWDDAYPLFWERVLLSEVASMRNVAIGGHVAGVFRKHETQSSLLMFREGKSEVRRQWEMLAPRLAQIARQSGDSWRNSLAAILPECGKGRLQGWLAEASNWPNTPFCNEVKAILAQAAGPSGNERGSRSVQVVKNVFRESTPPILWRMLRRLAKGNGRL